MSDVTHDFIALLSDEQRSVIINAPRGSTYADYGDDGSLMSLAKSISGDLSPYYLIADAWPVLHTDTETYKDYVKGSKWQIRNGFKAWYNFTNWPNVSFLEDGQIVEAQNNVRLNGDEHTVAVAGNFVYWSACPVRWLAPLLEVVRDAST